jgi:ribosomal-protein-alanine N-acetyltransferase
MSAAPGITLRGFRQEDLDAMYALDVVCFEEPFRFSRAMMQQAVEDEFARVVIAERGARMSGFAVLQVERVRRELLGYVVTLDVTPQERRRGVAWLMMERLEQDAREAGCAAMVLHVFAGNAGAIRFYESIGFVRVGEARNFYSRGLNAWIYRKGLSRTAE